LWYLVYRDADNKPRTVKGSTDSIRKNFVDGTLGEQAGILVSRLKVGPFNLLKSIPEFRDLVIQPAPAPNLGTGKPQFALWIGGVVLLAVLIAAAVYVLIP
jgi:hypothetical protein